MEKRNSPRITWFGEKARKKIVEEAMCLLEEIGVFVENDEALELLHGAGCSVDSEKKRVKIPSSVVEKAVESAPSKVTLYDRSGEAAMELAGDSVHFNPGSAALRIYDPKERRARKAMTIDLVRLATLIDTLPNYAAQSTALVSSDVPREVQDSYRLYIALSHCTKPVVTGTFRVDGFRAMHEMLAAVVGGSERLREKPNAIFDCCPSPPLKWSELTAQALIDCARTGIVAELISMPLAGATSPVTLAGAVTQHCAENLSGVVIHQLASPGAPIVWGGSPAFFDMRKGTTPMGAIETMMIDGAYAEIGKHLGFPVQAYMGLSDSKIPDFQAGMETAMGAVIAALSGINNVSGPGMLDFESCQSLEKLVLDNEICGMALRLAEGIKLRDDPIVSSELMNEGISRGSFLAVEHTMRWFRKEAYFPGDVIDRLSYEGWLAGGAKDSLRRAEDSVDRLLSSHRAEPLDSAIECKLAEIMQREASRYGMDSLPKVI